MPKPRLPNGPSEGWDCSFVFNPPRPLRSVQAHGGMVVAGGADLCVLRPAATGWKVREAGDDIKDINVVAAEPKGQRRIAVATDDMIAVFIRTKSGSENILRLRPAVPQPKVTHLAWGASQNGTCSLYALRDDLSLVRLKPDLSDMELLEVPGAVVSAMASDANGVLALVSVLGDEPRVYVSSDGYEMKYRQLPDDIDTDLAIHVAVADTAVALAVNEDRVLISRQLTDAFETCVPLSSAEENEWVTGPVAFQGTTSDSALFAVQLEPHVMRIARSEPSGETRSVVEMDGVPAHGDGAPVGLELVALSWDATRKTLWGVSPVTGLTSMVAPSAKGSKRVLLS